MVVRTSVSGVKGRHAAGRPRVPVRGVLAVLGACIVVAGVVTGLTLAGSGGHGPARRGAIGAGRGSPAGQLNVTAAARAPSPRTPSSLRTFPSPSPRTTPAAGSAAGQRDPFAMAASFLSGRAGTVAAAVYDIATGRTWRLGGGQPQDEASVVKLDVLETLLAEQDQDDGAGLSASDESLAEQMIEDSDNDAATSLWYEVGGAAGIRSFNAKAGLTHTVPSSCVTCPDFPWAGWGLTATTPDDQIALLRQLVMPGSMLTAAERAYALSLMEDVTPSQQWGVSGGVPAQVTVALKDGWLPLRGTDGDWQINSVGWVSGGGRDYLMAVLTTGNPTEQYGIDTIDQLAAMVWQRMG
jgi:hypothetical protein